MSSAELAAADQQKILLPFELRESVAEIVALQQPRPGKLPPEPSK